MELEIISDKENKMLERREITFRVGNEGRTPSVVEIKQALCKKLGISPESTEIIKVNQGFGSRESTGLAHSYSKQEGMKAGIPGHITARRAKKAKKDVEQAAKQEQGAQKDGA